MHIGEKLTMIPLRALTIPLILSFVVVAAVPMVAQPVPLAPSQPDQLVARIALYPDPLLAQVLTASTRWNEIQEAAQWAGNHSHLTGDALAVAIREDNLQWDPSVIALLPFPSVLDMMSRDPGWTEQLGDAVLTQRPEVMELIRKSGLPGIDLVNGGELAAAEVSLSG